MLKRGNDYLCDEARRATRLPPGHPEAFIEAFANVYADIAAAIRADREGLGPDGSRWAFPTVYEGARGVHFIEKVVESGRSDRKWTPASWQSAAEQHETA